jgi:hypothetical protein
MVVMKGIIFVFVVILSLLFDNDKKVYKGVESD